MDSPVLRIVCAQHKGSKSLVVKFRAGRTAMKEQGHKAHKAYQVSIFGQDSDHRGGLSSWRGGQGRVGVLDHRDAHRMYKKPLHAESGVAPPGGNVSQEPMTTRTSGQRRPGSSSVSGELQIQFIKDAEFERKAIRSEV